MGAVLHVWTGVASMAALLFAQPQPDARRPDGRTAVTKFFEAQRFAGSGDYAGAVAALEVVAQAKRGFLPGPQNALSKLRNDPKFAPVFATLEADFPRTANGRVAYRFNDGELMPEGIAYDAGRRRLFLSDWKHKSIYQFGPGDAPQPLLSMAPLTPNGMIVDQSRDLLWVVATDAFRGVEQPKSELLRVDLRSGKRQAYSADTAKGFNDVAVAPNGDVYVSDTPGNQIFRLRQGSGRLEAFVGADTKLRSPNGLTVDSSGRYLFVAQGLTPFRIRLSDGDIALLKLPSELDMIGTDGFYFRDGELYAIQNLVTPGRILRLTLDEPMEAVTAVEVLDSGHPDFDLPTTGTFVGNRFLVVANSQLYKIADEKSVGVKADPLVLLSYPLPAPKTGVRLAIRP